MSTFVCLQTHSWFDDYKVTGFFYQRAPIFSSFKIYLPTTRTLEYSILTAPPNLYLTRVCNFIFSCR